MKLEWILLALFLISMVRNLAKAMRNPMLKNFMRLISILVAFIITFILQICGLFQGIAEKIVAGVQWGALFPKFANAMQNSANLIVPFCTTIISPFLFVLTFTIILLVLNIVHVNFIYKFIMKKKLKREIREFKQALKEEKMMLKKAIADNETRFMDIIKSISMANPDMDTYRYQSLTEEEIERMVEQRIKQEKKKKKFKNLKKKSTFFKESSEQKAISLVCGVVSGFLLFGIMWMGLFYSMDFLSDVTDGIETTGADNGKVYHMVQLVDDHLVTPYEESFVYKLYDSMAMVDLMKFTVAAGGRLDNNPAYKFADDMMRVQTRSAIRLACIMTSNNEITDDVKQEIKLDVDALLDENSVFTLIAAEFIIDYVENVDIEELDQNNFGQALLGSIVKNYQGNKALVAEDLASMSDVVVIAAQNKLLADIIASDSDMLIWVEDEEKRETVKELVAAISHLSFYPETMESVFTMGVDAFGATFMPADNEAAYNKFIENLVSAANGITTIADADLENLVNFVTGYGDFTDVHTEDGVDGLLAYVLEPLYKLEEIVIKGEEIKAIADQITAKAEEIVAVEEQIENSTDADEIATLTAQLNTLIAEEETLAAQEQVLLDEETALIDAAQNADYITVFENRIKALGPFVYYFMNWTNVQKPFMLAVEDTTTACMATVIGSDLYVCNTDALTIDKLLNFINNNDSEDFEGLLDGFQDGSSDSASDYYLPEGFRVANFASLVPGQDILGELTIYKNPDLSSDEWTNEDGENYRVSLLTNLVNYLIDTANTFKNVNSGAEIGNEWLYATFSSYHENYCSADCDCVACKIVAAKDAPDTFDYKGATVEGMKAEMNFGTKEGQEWTLEQREADSASLVEAIYALMDVMSKMGTDGGIDADNLSEDKMATILPLLESIGTAMDEMSKTSCLNDLPAMMVQSILKNDMLSKVMGPSMLYGTDIDSGDEVEPGYMVQLQAIQDNYHLPENERDPELTYANFMKVFVEDINYVLENIDGNGDNTDEGGIEQ